MHHLILACTCILFVAKETSFEIRSKGVWYLTHLRYPGGGGGHRGRKEVMPYASCCRSRTSRECEGSQEARFDTSTDGYMGISMYASTPPPRPANVPV